MFNKDGIFGKRDEDVRADPRSQNVNVTPDLRSGTARQQPASGLEPQQLERSFSEPKSTPAPAPAQEESSRSKLIVGPDIKLKGVEITDCDTLVVEGRVEASMDSRVVQIAKNGVFTGNATMDVAEIWGTFEGQLTVRQQLVIYETGRVSGQIRYGRIRIEEGGEVSGDVSNLGEAQKARRSEPTPAPREANRPPATESLRGSAAPVQKAGATVR